MTPLGPLGARPYRFEQNSVQTGCVHLNQTQMSTSYLNFVAHSKPRDKAENSIIRTCVMFSFESSDFRRLCDFGLFRTNIAIS